MRTLLLAATLALTACDSQPPPKTIDEIDQFVRIADKSIGVVQKIGAGASTEDVRAAMQEMYAAFDAAQNQINEVRHQITVGKYLGRGSIDPIDVSACIGAHTSSVGWIESETLRPIWVMSALECAINASTYFEALRADDGAAAAQAVGIIYPIVLVANAKVGLEVVPSLHEYRSINEAIIAKFAPTCGQQKNVSPARNEQVRYACAAYLVAMSVQPKLETLVNQLPKPS